MAEVRVREVARRLSVSPATVSRVLQGTYARGPVSVATATKVLDHCFGRGYITKEERDQILLKMKIQVSDKKIFCLSCFDGLWAYNAIFAGMSGCLQDKGQYASFYTVRSSSDLAHFPHDVASTIIVIGRITPDTYHALREYEVPIVLADNCLPDTKWSTVNSDNLGGMSRAVEILAELGHKRIAFMCRHEDFPQKTFNFHQRQSGYLVGMANAGLPCEGLIVTAESGNDYSPDYHHQEVLSELRQLANRVLEIDPLPTAVVAANDLTAHVLRAVLREKGLRVPQDVSIVGYDGQHRIPGIMGFEPVSTLVVNYGEMARMIVDLATESMVDPRRVPCHIIIPNEYEDMGTVAPPRA